MIRQRESYIFRPPSYSSEVLKALNEQRKRKDSCLCDITLVMGGTFMLAHKAVLSACSVYFKDRFIEKKTISRIEIDTGRTSPINFCIKQRSFDATGHTTSAALSPPTCKRRRKAFSECLPETSVVYSPNSPMSSASLSEFPIDKNENGVIILPGIKSQAFSSILDYMYTAELSINKENIQDFLLISCLLQIEPVLEACTLILAKEPRWKMTHLKLPDRRRPFMTSRSRRARLRAKDMTSNINSPLQRLSSSYGDAVNVEKKTRTHEKVGFESIAKTETTNQNLPAKATSLEDQTHADDVQQRLREITSFNQYANKDLNNYTVVQLDTKKNDNFNRNSLNKQSSSGNSPLNFSMNSHRKSPEVQRPDKMYTKPWKNFPGKRRALLHQDGIDFSFTANPEEEYKAASVQSTGRHITNALPRLQESYEFKKDISGKPVVFQDDYRELHHRRRCLGETAHKSIGKRFDDVRTRNNDLDTIDRYRIPLDFMSSTVAATATPSLPTRVPFFLSAPSIAEAKPKIQETLIFDSLLYPDSRFNVSGLFHTRPLAWYPSGQMLPSLSYISKPDAGFIHRSLATSSNSSNAKLGKVAESFLESQSKSLDSSSYMNSSNRRERDLPKESILSSQVQQSLSKYPLKCRILAKHSAASDSGAETENHRASSVDSGVAVGMHVNANCSAEELSSKFEDSTENKILSLSLVKNQPGFEQHHLKEVIVSRHQQCVV